MWAHNDIKQASMLSTLTNKHVSTPRMQTRKYAKHVSTWKSQEPKHLSKKARQAREHVSARAIQARKHAMQVSTQARQARHFADFLKRVFSWKLVFVFNRQMDGFFILFNPDLFSFHNDSCTNKLICQKYCTLTYVIITLCAK